MSDAGSKEGAFTDRALALPRMTAEGRILGNPFEDFPKHVSPEIATKIVELAAMSCDDIMKMRVGKGLKKLIELSPNIRFIYQTMRNRNPYLPVIWRNPIEDPYDAGDWEKFQLQCTLAVRLAKMKPLPTTEQWVGGDFSEEVLRAVKYFQDFSSWNDFIKPGGKLGMAGSFNLLLFYVKHNIHPAVAGFASAHWEKRVDKTGKGALPHYPLSVVKAFNEFALKMHKRFGTDGVLNDELDFGYFRDAALQVAARGKAAHERVMKFSHDQDMRNLYDWDTSGFDFDDLGPLLVPFQDSDGRIKIWNQYEDWVSAGWEADTRADQDVYRKEYTADEILWAAEQMLKHKKYWLFELRGKQRIY